MDTQPVVVVCRATAQAGPLIADLERNHKRFMHDTYYAGDTLRLI